MSYVDISAQTLIEKQCLDASNFFLGSYGLKVNTLTNAHQHRVKIKEFDEYSIFVDHDESNLGKDSKSGSTELSIKRSLKTYSSSNNNQIATKNLERKTPRVETCNPWKLMRVISGHSGWVRAIAVEPGNEWFATGGADRLIKIWDLASGSLKLSLVGHINTVRGLAISSYNPYMFSCSEDKTVKCWDLETNKVIRSYHGHLSGVNCLSLHPSSQVLLTGGRDAAVRVWDVRTKAEVLCLSGHSGAVSSLISRSDGRANGWEVVSGSADKMVRLWDIRQGGGKRCVQTLTHHKKGIRALAWKPAAEEGQGFYSGGGDRVKSWRPSSESEEARVLFEADLNPDLDSAILTSRSVIASRSPQNFEIVGSDWVSNSASLTGGRVTNCLAVRESDGLTVGGSLDGVISFWDGKSKAKVGEIQGAVLPGSDEDAESGIFCMAFDKSESRLISGECDKSIKIWKEIEEDCDSSKRSRWLREVEK
eukprot:GDKK01065504.1.p1 GENE.GDKK01065504.1~~GDKK01065504.1.p1  ORF type:complete len:495 (-),score=79.88 GDKK01065504.1:49-1482(-)